jgi:multiple sugar transport system substrate-binding protein
MTRPLQEGKLFAKNKYYEFLNSYLQDKTAASWDWKDFPASTVDAVTFQNDVYAIPIVTEWETLFYRTDMFKQAGVAVPKTLDELMAAARKLNNPSAGTYGIVSRGQRGAAVTQFSSYLYNLGGDFIVNGRAAFNSNDGMKAFRFYGEMLGKYGPPGATNMSWPQAQALFASGKVAMWTDASTLIAGLLDPAKSQISDKLGVAPFPTGPAGNHAYMVVPWALAMGAQGSNKNTAWEFVKWAASKGVAKTSLLKGVTVARQSVWDDPEVVKQLFPGLADSSKAIAATARSYDRPLMTAVGEARDAIGTVITQSIETSGQGDLKGTADAAVAKVDELLQKAGELGQ